MVGGDGLVWSMGMEGMERNSAQSFLGSPLLQSKTIRVTGGQLESALISFLKKESFYLLCAQLERASAPQKPEGTSTRRGG